MLDSDEHAGPDARRLARLLPQVRARLRKVAERRLHLVECARDDGPEQCPDQRQQPDVVHEDPDGAGYATAPERLDSRTHGCSHDEAEEEQGEDQLELPEREREHDDRADDDGRHEGAESGLLHPYVLATRRKRKTAPEG